MIKLDGTQNKAKLGANSILGVSMAFARASAKCNQISFYKSFQSSFEHILPTPMMNIVNGGSHANNNIDNSDNNHNHINNNNNINRILLQ